VTDAFTYAELDEILRGNGRNGAIGISAIDGLIAALVAAPSFVHPDEWVPLIFGGRQPPLHENSPELRAVKTIFNRYNEVSEILADRPAAYRPIFMVDDDGSIVARLGGRLRTRDRAALRGVGSAHPAHKAPARCSSRSWCRREGIVQNLYYRWSKEFLEAQEAPGRGYRAIGDRARGHGVAPGSRRVEGGRCRARAREPPAQKKHDRGWGGRRMR
jgi:hypothetical protein